MLLSRLGTLGQPDGDVVTVSRWDDSRHGTCFSGALVAYGSRKPRSPTVHSLVADQSRRTAVVTPATTAVVSAQPRMV